MSFRWTNSPQTPKPPTPEPIPENAVSSEVNVVANTVNAGGSLLYNTAAVGYDVVYEIPSMNVIDLRVTNANIKTALINTATINTASINTATIITLNVTTFHANNAAFTALYADNATFVTLNASFANLTNASIVTLNASTLMSGDPTANLGIATKQYVLAHSGGGSLPPSNGKGTLLIGNDSLTFDINPLTPGTGIYVNNANGEIDLVATGDPVLSGYRYGTAWKSAKLALDGSIYWNEIVYGGGLFVAVGTTTSYIPYYHQQGVIATTTDGKRWTIQQTNIVCETFLHVAWNGTNFVAMGYTFGPDHIYRGVQYPIAATSPDGVNWTQRNVPVNSGNLPWGRISWDGTQFIAVATYQGPSHVLTSPDGVNWTIRTLLGYDFVFGDPNNPGQVVSLQSVAYSQTAYMGVFLGLGGSVQGQIVFNQQGIDSPHWIIKYPYGPAAGYTASLKIIWNGSYFLLASVKGPWMGTITAGANGDFYIAAASGGPKLDAATDVIWCADQSKFVMVGTDPGNPPYTGDQNVLTSSNGITWTAQTGLPFKTMNSVAYGGGNFVSVGIAGAMASSPDAVTWTDRTFVPDDWRSIAFAPTLSSTGLLVAIRSATIGPDGVVMVSTDGYTWSEASAPAATWRSLAWNGSVFAAVAEDGTVMSSSDGSNWTTQSAPFGTWKTIAWDGNLFAAIATNGNVITSPDGSTWTSRTGVGGTFAAVANGASKFVVVGTNSVMTSPTGITWTSRTGISGNWNSIAWNGHDFVAVGLSGAVMSSPDGITWTSRTGISGDWMGVAWNGSVFAAVGDNILMTSPDGIHWIQRFDIPVGTWVALAWNGSIFVAVGNGAGSAVMTNWNKDVTSVAGRVGAIELTTDDVTENILVGPLYFTQARVRSNVSATIPITYEESNGIFGHANSGVTAATYGNTVSIPVISVDSFGHITAVTNTSVGFSSNVITATLTNDSANANNLGAFLSVVSATGGVTAPVTTAVYTNLCSMIVGAGDWDMEGSIELSVGATTVATRLTGGISLTTNAIDVSTAGGFMAYQSAGFVVSQKYIFPTGRRRISLSAATRVNLVGALTFTTLGGATWGANSFMSARRSR